MAMSTAMMQIVPLISPVLSCSVMMEMMMMVTEISTVPIPIVPEILSVRRTVQMSLIMTSMGISTAMMPIAQMIQAAVVLLQEKRIVMMGWMTMAMAMSIVMMPTALLTSLVVVLEREKRIVQIL